MFACVDFSCVNVPLRVGRAHMKPVEPAAGMAEESEVAKRLAVGSIHDPHHVIHDVRDV